MSIITKTSRTSLVSATTTNVTRPLDLEPADIVYREQREAIVHAGAKASIAAARALSEIYFYRDGVLWKSDYENFQLYTRAKWGFGKSQGYRQVQIGVFLLEWENFSQKGENSPVNASHVQKLIDQVPSNLRVECWNTITASTPPSELTAEIVCAEANKFLAAKGIESCRPKRAKAEENERERALRVLKDLRSSVANLAAERFEKLFAEIALLIEMDPSNAIVDVEVIEIPSGDGCDSADRTPAPHVQLRDGDNEIRVRSVPKEARAPITVESVVEAMAAVAPPSDRLMVKASAKPDKKPPAEPQLLNDPLFMSARLLHAAVCPEEDYSKWVPQTAEAHPGDIIIPEGGGPERISLIRAKNFSFHFTKARGREAFKLICSVENNRVENPGAVLDSEFEKMLSEADNSDETSFASLNREPALTY